MKTYNRPMGLIEWALLITLSVVWGGSFFFIGVAVLALPPLTIVVLRVGLAAIALNVIVRAVGLSMSMDRRTWTTFFCMGLLNNMIPFSLIVWAQTHIASGLASILNATTPLFTVIVAHFLTKDERMSGWRFTGVVVGFTGVVLIIGPEALQGLGTNIVAQTAVLAAALSYAFAGIFGRRFRAMGVAALVTATGQLTASTIMMIPLAIVVDRPWMLPMPGLEIWGAVLGLVLLSTALAYILYFRILATAGATNVLLVTFLIPVSAILLSTTILGEQLEPKHFTGMGIIGLGLALIDGRPLGFLRRLV
jgi:drug/metabolite transporter (DMT)-like permease